MYFSFLVLALVCVLLLGSFSFPFGVASYYQKDEINLKLLGRYGFESNYYVKAVNIDHYGDPLHLNSEMYLLLNEVKQFKKNVSRIKEGKLHYKKYNSMLRPLMKTNSSLVKLFPNTYLGN